jgi:hypothetical protein
MAQLRANTRATFDGSSDWLAGLVEAFGATERLTEEACDPLAKRAMRARLSRPTSTAAFSRKSRTIRRYSPASCNRGS